jgi:1,2-phenylacetyl-CoA epoxidase catalytic subunit
LRWRPLAGSALPLRTHSPQRNRSRTNDRYRYWGIKTRTNEEMRKVYFADVMPIIRDKWGIDVPDRLEDWWNGKTAQAAGDGGYKYAGMSLSR